MFYFQTAPKSVRPKTFGLLLASTSFLVTAYITSALADNDVIWLPGITIYSANKTPTDAAKVGSQVEVITEEDLKKSPKKYVKDYLETLPGVNFSQSGGAGKNTTLSIRGAGAEYVKVLVDGMDISDPTQVKTSTAFEHLLIGDVARIEVLKGSQGTLYGSNAVGGVINITTRQSEKKGFSQSAQTEYGSYNTKSGSYTLGYNGEKGNISFTAQGITSDGFSAADDRNGNTEDDGYDNLTLSGRGEYKFNDIASVFFALRTVNSKSQFDDFGTLPSGASGPVDGPFDNREDMKQRAGRVGLNLNLLDGKFQNTFAVQGLETEREYFGSFPSLYEGDRIKGEYQGIYHFNKHYSVLFGTDWERNGAEVSSFTDTKRETADVWGTFAQLNLEPVKNLNFTLSGRHDDHSRFGDFNTYRLTASYLFEQTQTKIRGSTGTGYRAPSLYELYDPLYGNGTLQPEESQSWDIGLEQGLFNNKAKLGITYFNLDTDNLIGFDATTYQSIQITGTTERHGVELFGTAQLHEMLSVSASYTYTDTEKEDGNRLIRVPKHMIVLGADIKPTDKLTFNVSAKIVRDTLDGFGAGTPLDDYVLLNASVNYELQKGLDLYLRGENLLDEDYQTVRGYGTSDLAVYAGLKWTME